MKHINIFTFATLFLALSIGGCNSKNGGDDEGEKNQPKDDAGEDKDIGDDDDNNDDAPPVDPTYWSEEATKTIDDLAYVYVEEEGAPKKLFAIGYDTHSKGPWDGVSGRNECYQDEEGVWHGIADNARELNRLAAEAGANFAYVWSGRDKMDDMPRRLYGIWHDKYGVEPSPEKDIIPIVLNRFGESDMEQKDRDAKIENMKAIFQEFKNRTGEFSSETRPSLPPYEKMPWLSWHPTWRIRGGGDGKSEALTDEQADGFASTTTMMIADSYTYVTNRWDERTNPLTGQKGAQGEGYDDWLEWDDPDHRSYFTAAWDMIYSAVTRSRKNPADPEKPTVVWAWMQGHAFDDDIGRGQCQNGSSDLWAMGKFPTMSYLRKEIASTIVAGGTGIIFFGYMYCREPEAEKVRSFMRALSSKEVYEPALLSPRLDLGVDLTFVGEEGYDGKGRAHLLAKWHAETKTAFIIGANPGARATPFEVEFPWTIEKAELLDWETPAFALSEELKLSDKILAYTAPRDEGFIIRITPKFKPN